jgi:uncharacterized membrane protein
MLPGLRAHRYFVPGDRAVQPQSHSILFWLAVIIGGMLLSAISFVILALPFVGWIISFLLSLAYWLGAVLLWLYLMYKAYNRERVVLPVIGPWAEKQAQSV